MQQVNYGANNQRFLLGTILNIGFVLVELYYGFRANSIALIADAVHNASDVLGILLIWFSQYMASRPAPVHFTYGYKNITIFATFLNLVILFVAVGNIVLEAIERLHTVQIVSSNIIIVVAGIGVLINLSTALIFMRGSHIDIGMRSIFLNMALDAGISVCVVIGGLFMGWLGWYWLDPTLSLFIAVAIFVGFMGLFKESVNLIFQAVPSSINLHDVEAEIMKQPQVHSYHDLHVWPLSTTETALSVHIVSSQEQYDPNLVHHLAQIFATKYNIQHSTIQLEIVEQATTCKLD